VNQTVFQIGDNDYFAHAETPEQVYEILHKAVKFIASTERANQLNKAAIKAIKDIREAANESQ